MMAARRAEHVSGGNFHSPLTPFSVTPAHATSRSRSTIFFQVPFPVIRFSGPLRSIFRSHSANMLWMGLNLNM